MKDMFSYLFHFIALSIASGFSLLLFLVIVSMALSTADILGVFAARVMGGFLVCLSIFVAFMNVKMWKLVLAQLRTEND
ncbi:hypothetical protein LCGC14_0429460 [marine sediment metagenome]|uniref:Uncharacterized protein n=1 Tax=marine sediment metagenome TaxID=412755 RepID=A0A0F9SNB0_9ZZZZ